MMRLATAVFAITVACLPWTARALQPEQALHQYVHASWSIQHGLPQISALSIAQGRSGYIWVGTQAGLARFDGVRFVHYTAENTPALPGNWISSLQLAADGRLWVGTYKGVAVHDGNRFTGVPPIDDGALSLDTRALTEDAQGVMWVATTTGVYRAHGDRLHPVVGSPHLAQSLLARADGLWVGARGAVHRYADGRWHAMPLPAGATAATVNRLTESQGRIWAATTLGLFVHTAQGGWHAFAGAPQLARTSLELLYPDRDGNLWVGGDVGVARIRAGQLASFVAPTDAGGIAGLRTAFEDREGSLWLGSQWEGLVRLSDSWTRRYSVAEGLLDKIVWSLAPHPDGERIWIGGNDGLSLLDNGRVRLVVPGSDLPHPQGYNLLAEPGRVWVGTRRGLVVVDLDGERVLGVRQPARFAPLRGAQINGIVRLDNDDLWIATTEGLYRLRGDQLRRFAQAEGLSDPRIRFFFRTAQGVILAATQSGLFEMRGERFFATGADRGLPAQVDVTAIGQLDDGGLVIGTLDEQIYFQHERRWHAVGSAQGMPSNAPFFLTQHEGFLWAAGIRGIARVAVADLVALAEGRMKQVHGAMLLNERGDPKSGQQGYCCNGAGNSKGLRRGSTLWLPTRDGVLAMDVAAIRMNPVAPNVVIERVLTGEQWRMAGEMRNTQLPAEARDLSFEFTVLSFQDPKSTGVQYRLRGYDRDWQVADPLNRSARYTNLPPGDYVFEVNGSNNAGVASRMPARLAFTILPRFHETAWFTLLLALVLAVLVFAGYRYQRHRHRLQRRALETLVLQRTEALEIANHHLEEASHTDPLTNLRNRRYMASQIPTDLAYYDRQIERGAYNNEVMVFAMVDIDHFKLINDRHGHTAGDHVLQQFAQLLNGLVRSGDYVVRWGGEEFLLVFRPMPMRNLQVLGDRLRATVNAFAFEIGNGRTLQLTCSVGLSEYPLFRTPNGQVNWETMIELADQALYYVKSHGRDGWAAFRPTEHTDMTTLLDDLHQGPDELLARKRLQVVGSGMPDSCAVE